MEKNYPNMDIKDRYTETFLKAANKTVSDNEIKKNRALWWWNVRGKGAGGLRLTDQAIEFIEKEAEIKTYKIEFPKEFSFTPQVLLWLDKYIESPYYITKKNIFVLREKAAFELYLFSGDIRKIGHNKALAKRLIQESSEE
jgi:hypothetical protein